MMNYKEIQPIVAEISFQGLSFTFPRSSRPESPREHLPTNAAEVLRLRAIKPLLCARSARRCAQDDGFWAQLKNLRFDGKWTKRQKSHRRSATVFAG
jgi:hypothetical protein